MHTAQPNETLWDETRPEWDGKRDYILCVGDSITYGHGVILDRNNSSYPALLEKLLNGQYQVLNYGLCGRTALEEGDIPYSMEAYYEESMKLHPRAVVFMLGTNDAKSFNWNAERYETDLTALLKEYRNITENVIVMMPPKAHIFEPEGQVMFEIVGENVEEAANIVEKAANNLGLPCINLFALTEAHPEWFTDGIHPNLAGNMAIANKVYSAVQSILKN